MENAGRAVAEAIDEWMGADGATVLVLVGPGNNGGDGLVAARYLADMGATVHIYVWKRETANDKNWHLLSEKPVSITRLKDDTGLDGLRRMVDEADIIVDALLGTGIERLIKGDLERLLRAVGQVLAERRRPRTRPCVRRRRASTDVAAPTLVAVDVPTGLNSDTGAVDPVTPAADMTVTMAAVKRGHHARAGTAHDRQVGRRRHWHSGAVV